VAQASKRPKHVKPDQKSPRRPSRDARRNAANIAGTKNNREMSISRLCIGVTTRNAYTIEPMPPISRVFASTLPLALLDTNLNRTATLAQKTNIASTATYLA